MKYTYSHFPWETENGRFHPAVTRADLCGVPKVMNYSTGLTILGR